MRQEIVFDRASEPKRFRDWDNFESSFPLSCFMDHWGLSGCILGRGYAQPAGTGTFSLLLSLFMFYLFSAFLELHIVFGFG